MRDEIVGLNACLKPRIRSELTNQETYSSPHTTLILCVRSTNERTDRTRSKLKLEGDGFSPRRGHVVRGPNIGSGKHLEDCVPSALNIRKNTSFFCSFSLFMYLVKYKEGYFLDTLCLEHGHLFHRRLE